MSGQRWVYDDGGRAAAGYRGSTGDCVTRAIAIATEMSYQEVYDDLFVLARIGGKKKGTVSPRTGVRPNVTRTYLAQLGWTWTPTMQIGSGTTVHARADELPAGRLILRLSKHIVAMIDGVIHDTHDPTRDGTRCVYGVWERV